MARTQTQAAPAFNPAAYKAQEAEQGNRPNGSRLTLGPDRTMPARLEFAVKFDGVTRADGTPRPAPVFKGRLADDAAVSLYAYGGWDGTNPIVFRPATDTVYQADGKPVFQVRSGGKSPTGENWPKADSMAFRTSIESGAVQIWLTMPPDVTTLPDEIVILPLEA